MDLLTLNTPPPPAPPGAVRFHPRRSDGGHSEQGDGGARLTAAHLRQQHPHAQLHGPHAAGEAVQGERAPPVAAGELSGARGSGAVGANGFNYSRPRIRCLLARRPVIQ